MAEFIFLLMQSTQNSTFHTSTFRWWDRVWGANYNFYSFLYSQKSQCPLCWCVIKIFCVKSIFLVGFMSVTCFHIFQWCMLISSWITLFMIFLPNFWRLPLPLFLVNWLWGYLMVGLPHLIQSWRFFIIFSYHICDVLSLSRNKFSGLLMSLLWKHT